MNIASALPSPGVLAAVSAAVFLLGILIGYLLGRRRNQAPQPEILLQQLQQRIDGLARIFEMPRYRGQAGEWMLEQLLQDCLPPSAFRTQHSFRSGGRVDALIQLGNASVAVDAKFPLESLQGWQDAAISARALKSVLQHAESISQKYILPDEGTMNFAIMYIPSEAMFSRLFSDIRLLRGCLQLGVVPASPSNLFLYVQTVSYGLRGMEFSRNFSRYAGQFEQIRLQIGKLAEILATGHGHLRNLQRSYDAVLHGLDGVQERLNEI